MKLEAFLELEQPEAFDFKDLMEEHYRGRWLRLQSSLEKMTHSNDQIEKWYLYRTADSEFKSLFDCDRCELVNEIYRLIWSVSKQLGPDTINSFARTFGHSAGGSYQAAYGSYIDGNENLSVFSEFAKWTSCIGNYVLVPAGYNKYRGGGCMKDYWDLSLHNLKYNCDGKNWLEDVGFRFEQYVNIFFLWDYVRCEGGEYKVKRLFREDAALWEADTSFPYENVFPAKEEVPVFLKNVNQYIKNRGIFMVKMLKISLERHELYKEIMEYLHSGEECFAGTEDAAEKIAKKFPGV